MDQGLGGQNQISTSPSPRAMEALHGRCDTQSLCGRYNMVVALILLLNNIAFSLRVAISICSSILYLSYIITNKCFTFSTNK